MKSVPNSNRMVRLTHDLHRQVKIIAALDNLPVSQVVGQAVEREIRRRARRLAPEDALTVSLAPCQPTQTR